MPRLRPTTRDFLDDASHHVGPPPDEQQIERGIAENERWERSVLHLAATEAFPDHLFFRAIRLVEVGSEAPIEMRDGAWPVTAGRAYSLDLVHYQPDPPEVRQYLEVLANEEVFEVSGSTRIVVSSGYDRVRRSCTSRTGTSRKSRRSSSSGPTGNPGPSWNFAFESSHRRQNSVFAPRLAPER